MSRVNAQLHREEGYQKPQPPLYAVEYPFLPSPFPVLWEPMRETGRDPGALSNKIGPTMSLLD